MPRPVLKAVCGVLLIRAKFEGTEADLGNTAPLAKTPPRKTHAVMLRTSVGTANEDFTISIAVELFPVYVPPSPNDHELLEKIRELCEQNLVSEALLMKVGNLLMHQKTDQQAVREMVARSFADVTSRGLRHGYRAGYKKGRVEGKAAGVILGKQVAQKQAETEILTSSGPPSDGVKRRRRA